MKIHSTLFLFALVLFSCQRPLPTPPIRQGEIRISGPELEMPITSVPMARLPATGNESFVR